MADTIRDMIRTIQREVREEKDLQGHRASELTNRLSALLGNVNDELRIADLEYKRVLLKCMQEHKAANRARIEAETTPEFMRSQEAKHMKELTVELIRSLKAFARAKTEEMRLG